MRCRRDALETRMRRHFEWYLREALSSEPDKCWGLNEIQDRLCAVCGGLRPHRQTILSRNARLFAQHQCSPFRRVSHDRYALDPHYFEILAGSVQPPMPRGRPRLYPQDALGQAWRERGYATSYQRTMRRLGSYLEEFHHSPHEFSLSDLRELIRADSGINCANATLKKRLGRYINGGCPRGPPIEEIEGRPGHYRLKTDP